MKFLNPGIGLSLLFVHYYIYYFRVSHPNISNWDYEGFTIGHTSGLFIGLVILVEGLYLLYKNDTLKFGEKELIIPKNNLTIPYHEINQVSNFHSIYTLHTSKGDFNIVNMFIKNQNEVQKMLFEELKFKQVKKSKVRFYLYLVALLIPLITILTFSSWREGEQKLKTFLPLKKIETTQIEGTIKNGASVSLNETEGRGTFTSVGLHGGLVEFPNIYFRNSGVGFSILADHIVNITDIEPEKREALNLKYNNGIKSKKMQWFPEGTKVKLKIRTKDYEDLKSYMATGEHLINKEGDFLRRTIRFYELSINDEIIIQKFGLKN